MVFDHTKGIHWMGNREVEVLPVYGDRSRVSDMASLLMSGKGPAAFARGVR